MRKIGWIQIFTTRREGGIIYGERVRNALSGRYDLELKKIKAEYLNWRYFRPLEWFWRFIRLKEKKDLWIRDDFISIIAMPLVRAKGKKMAIIYHIDFSVYSFWQRFIYYFFTKIFYRNLRKADAIVTISEYWRKHFLEKGYKNVYKIYNAFDLADFKISNEEVSEFKGKFKLEGKPIVYIGNCQKTKGVVETYQALKDLDVHLITSGEQTVKIPAINLNLEYKEYLKLLKASSLMVEMIKFKTGGSRTSQEAMLLKTAVIGSGMGATEELLKGGKQVICNDFGSLKEKVKYLLAHPEIRKKIGEDGYSFAKDFTIDKFNKAWLDSVKKLTD